jgi:cytoskeleton protein RodZ
MADIGTSLREARIRARIDISEVEARTKIRAKYLRAIENEEWDLLPGPVYVKSFLRTYSDFLGLDSRQLVDEYKRRYERPADSDVRPISALARDKRDRPRRRPRLGPFAAVALVLIAVVVVLALVGTLGKKSNTSTSTTTPAARPATTSTGATTSARNPSSHHHAGATHSATAPARPPAPPKPARVTLKLVPTSSVYVCLEDGNGKVLIPGETFAEGSTIPVKTANKLLLTLGNDAVQMQINGKSVPITPGSPIGYEITPTKTTQLTAGHLPTCT